MNSRMFINMVMIGKECCLVGKMFRRWSVHNPCHSDVPAVKYSLHMCWWFKLPDPNLNPNTIPVTHLCNVEYVKLRRAAKWNFTSNPTVALVMALTVTLYPDHVPIPYLYFAFHNSAFYLHPGLSSNTILHKITWSMTEVVGCVILECVQQWRSKFRARTSATRRSSSSHGTSTRQRRFTGTAVIRWWQFHERQTIRSGRHVACRVSAWCSSAGAETTAAPSRRPFSLTSSVSAGRPRKARSRPTTMDRWRRQAPCCWETEWTETLYTCRWKVLCQCWNQMTSFLTVRVVDLWFIGWFRVHSVLEKSMENAWVQPSQFKTLQKLLEKSSNLSTPVLENRTCW